MKFRLLITIWAFTYQANSKSRNFVNAKKITLSYCYLFVNLCYNNLLLKHSVRILLVLLLLQLAPAQGYSEDGSTVRFDFYGDTIEFAYTDAEAVPFTDKLSCDAIRSFYEKIAATDYTSVVNALLSYKQMHHPDDWVYYQLIRKTAQAISPKADNYYRYTLYKWFLLSRSGYDATLNVIGDRLLFYVQSDEDIYDIPYFHKNGKKYLCLNYHDYDFNINFDRGQLLNVGISVPGAESKFSYRLTRLPNFAPESYYEKDLAFNYHDVNYHFKVKMNEDVKKMFINYPVADYQLYFNEPLSAGTYNSLIPQLKKNIQRMSVKQGIDYLLHFTRYAFLYETDQEHFGREKHLSPEQTLLYDRSDCEDRAALFYCLVKELYNVPMIVLAFPHHLTIAVKFDEPIGPKIVFNGNTYSICEPTPQAEDLPIGGISPELKTARYEVAYAYDPAK